MAGKQGVSYPTLRNKLNALIELLKDIDVQQENSKEDILKLVEAGKLSALEAAKILRKL